MWMDIRWPIGLFFSALGALLAAYGLASGSSGYAPSSGINVNLEWGGVLLAFGLIMALLGRRAAKRSPPDGASPAQSPAHHEEK